ncbi:MAG: hypothetical protein P4L59_05650 [Desulfosporosinus sp.]|nr:hypothetical protein [Desulfosporosinus sp.]
MCGICGQFGPASYISVPRLKQMTRFIKHRGPDAEEFYVTPTLAFVNSPRSYRLIWALYVLEMYLAFALHPQEKIYPENFEDCRTPKIGGGSL